MEAMNYGFLKEIISDRLGKQKDLADLLGISLTALTNKLNNKVSFTYKECVKISAILNLNEVETYRCFFIAK